MNGQVKLKYHVVDVDRIPQRHDNLIGGCLWTLCFNVQLFLDLVRENKHLLSGMSCAPVSFGAAVCLVECSILLSS